MKSDYKISLESKISEVFHEKYFAKFREYCKVNRLIYLHQIENIDFMMFKHSFQATDEERYNAKEHWKKMLDLVSENVCQENYCDFYNIESHHVKEKVNEHLPDCYEIDNKASNGNIVNNKESKILNPKIKARIIDVLGEEIYNVCIKNPDKTIAFSNLFRLAIAEFDKANGISCKISSRLIEAKEVLGEEVCIWCLRNYKGVIDLINILSSYVQLYEDAEKTRKKVNELIEAIHPNNYAARIAPLVLAFRKNGEIDVLSKLFESANIFYVRELKRLSLLIKIDEADYNHLYSFLTWLGKDKKAKVKSKFLDLFKKDRDEKIVRKRSVGLTLEEIGKDYNLTRERVRQIEKKFQARFGNYVSRLKPQYIIYAFGKNRGYISVDEIKELFGDLSDIFIYCLNFNSAIKTE